MAKFNKLIFAVILVAGVRASAQDIHFSQFNQEPLALNPALTGSYECDWRAGLNYRSQWSEIPAPYTTYAAYFDIPVIRGIGGTDNLALGLNLYNDVSGDGNLSNLSAGLSAAYHKGLGRNHYISLGVQGSFSQKSLNWNNLYFANQFDGASFNSNLPNYEPYSGDNINNIDVALGLVYKGKFNKTFSAEVGGALNHLTTPEETFYKPDSINYTNELGMRITVHGKFIIQITQNLAVIPTGLFMTQSGAQEIVVGGDLGYYLKNPNFPATFYLGAYTRLDDAIIPHIALDYKNFKLGLSYDVNNSALDVATNGKGGLEISLMYTGCILPVVPDQYILPCPRY
ncbi:MAG: PorP/SprF family type IX secretion system membrane protein [Fimbriimonadaceae bacterium]|nr:PorP/SprF family type IX secretion system membrane protein [Chitinophagales bacterium]